jgi:hypothetical protein
MVTLMSRVFDCQSGRVRSDAFPTRSVISSNRPNDRPAKGRLGGLAMEGVVLPNGWTLRRSALERIE